MFISNDKKAAEKKPFYVRNQDGFSGIIIKLDKNEKILAGMTI